LCSAGGVDFAVDLINAPWSASIYAVGALIRTFCVCSVDKLRRMVMLHRRGFIGGLVGLIAAPAIVHVGNLMPIKVLEDDGWVWVENNAGILVDVKRMAFVPRLFVQLWRAPMSEGQCSCNVRALPHDPDELLQVVDLSDLTR
jgi:hypothetical protein